MATSDELSSVVARKTDEIRIIREITSRIGATMDLGRIHSGSAEDIA